MFARPRGLAGYDPEGRPEARVLRVVAGRSHAPRTNETSGIPDRCPGTATTASVTTVATGWCYSIPGLARWQVSGKSLIDSLVHQAADEVKTWPKYDLFETGSHVAFIRGGTVESRARECCWPQVDAKVSAMVNCVVQDPRSQYGDSRQRQDGLALLLQLPRLCATRRLPRDPRVRGLGPRFCRTGPGWLPSSTPWATVEFDQPRARRQTRRGKSPYRPSLEYPPDDSRPNRWSSIFRGSSNRACHFGTPASAPCECRPFPCRIRGSSFVQMRMSTPHLSLPRNVFQYTIALSEDQPASQWGIGSRIMNTPFHLASAFVLTLSIALANSAADASQDAWQLAWSYRVRQPPAPAFKGSLNTWRNAAGVEPIRYDHAFYPVSDGERLVLSSSSEQAVFCLDAHTGRRLWRFFADGPVRIRPTVADGRVFVGSDDGFVYCLDPATGELNWKFRGRPTSNGPSATVTSSPPGRCHSGRRRGRHGLFRRWPAADLGDVPVCGGRRDRPFDLAARDSLFAPWRDPRGW